MGGGRGGGSREEGEKEGGVWRRKRRREEGGGSREEGEEEVEGGGREMDGSKGVREREVRGRVDVENNGVFVSSEDCKESKNVEGVTIPHVCRLTYSLSGCSCMRLSLFTFRLKRKI